MARKSTDPFPDKVQDESGRVFHLRRKIGQGGQGAVFLAKEEGVAIKLIPTRPQGHVFEFEDQERIREFQEKFRHIRTLPLRDGEVMKPFAVLAAPYVGYAMEVLEGMEPLCDLMFGDGSDVIIPLDMESFQKYNESGGLKRRFAILAGIAEILAQIHGKGMVFADPSPNNFFIAADPQDDYVALIDSDNLEYQSRLRGGIASTPRFGAPELVQRTRGVSTLSDAYAFSIVAFWLLTGVHPLYGDMVKDGPPELEERAHSGELPWIDHAKDTANASSEGIPRDHILTPRLKALFAETFESGLETLYMRPGLTAWEEALREAWQGLVTCSGCGFHVQYDCPVCPLCGHETTDVILVRIQGWHPEIKDATVPAISLLGEDEMSFRGGLCNPTRDIAALALTEAEPVVLSARIITGDRGRTAEEHRLRLEYNASTETITVTSLVRESFWLGDEAMDRIETVRRSTSFTLDQAGEKPLLHFGGKNEYHRVALFEKRSGQS